MVLIIAEKQSLAEDITGALKGPATKVGGDYYICGNYTVTWLFGHVLTLKDPEDYDKKYGARSDLSLLPIYFNHWETKISDSKNNVKKNRVMLIGKLLKSAEYVIHAGDPDEEGQLLVDEVLRWHHYAGPVKRLNTSNTTKEALQKALQHMTDNKDHEKEGWSAYARSVADFTVGINLTRYYSAKNHMHLPFGRVKMPTLGLVVARDEKIENHKKTVYYEINGDVSFGGTNIRGKYCPQKSDPNLSEGKILSKPYAESKRKMMSGYKGKCTVTKSTVASAPPLPFNLVKLQSYCSVQYGYSPAETLEITQSLRTVHHAITYNRSDCQYLSEEHFKEAPKTVAVTLANLGKRYASLDTSIKSKCFNDGNITAHFAIIPSGQRLDMAKLSERERNVYRAICNYYLIQFLPPAKKEQTSMVMIMPDKGTVEARSTVVSYPGYLDVLRGEKTITEEAVSALSSIPAGDYSAEITSAGLEEKTTKPPARYTKASLNEDMTRIAKYVDNENVRKLLLAKDKDKKGENGSIGTSATRTMIIDDLIKLDYIRESGKQLISTEKGRAYYSILPDEFKKADMTAYWWAIQEDIKSGDKQPAALTESVLESVKQVLRKDYPLLKTMGISAPAASTSSGSIGTCPACGSPVITSAIGYKCSGKSGCQFIIWKNPMGSLFKKTRITQTQAKQLLQGKTISISKLYSERTNKTFRGNVSMQYDPTYKYGARLNVSFEQNVIGKCPICGGDIVEFEKGYRCTGNSRRCKFILWKNVKYGPLSKITITPERVRTMLLGKAATVKQHSASGTQRTEWRIHLEVNKETSEVQVKYTCVQ